MNLSFLLVLGVSSLAVASGDSITKSTYKGSSGLHDMAKASGKYMGTAVDQDIKDSAALKVLKNIHDFGMLTPGNAMKVIDNDFLNILTSVVLIYLFSLVPSGMPPSTRRIPLNSTTQTQ
ncbi:hypothetical protein DVH05_010079 [Phytophthora capsici]|nr:hypothetical protein DVH05_010079 [Phytophthora capsici]